MMSEEAYRQGINEEATIILLGDNRVGKTSIVERYLDDSFLEILISSTNQEYHEKCMLLKDGRHIKMNIRVLQGHNSDLRVTKEVIRKANIVIGVYDVADRYSFNACKELMKQFLKRKRDCLVFMVGNKIDLYRNYNTNVKFEVGKEYAESHGFLWMEVSARTGENIQALFDQVTDEICKIRNSKD
jgi:Ras-related protein Rab-5C